MTAFFESMRQLSYISVMALASIITALFYVLGTDLQMIDAAYLSNSNQLTLNFVNLTGVPYFFGIALFMFEGNALALEIYHQTEDAPKRFYSAFQYAIMITVVLIVTVGSLSYAAYG